MKMFDINGEMIVADVRPSTYPIRGISRSALQGRTGQYLQDKYPREPILEDFVVPGSKLSVDFFLPRLGLVVEVQSNIHAGFEPFFHGNRDTGTGTYHKQVKSDNTKARWAENNKYKFVEVWSDDDFGQLEAKHERL